MADSREPGAPLPGNWSDAFAALPQDAPPARAWASIAARLPPATTHRRGRARRMALAAMVGALAVGVLAWQRLPMQARAPQVASPASAGASSTASIVHGRERAAAPRADEIARAVARTPAAAPRAAMGPRSPFAAVTGGAHVDRARGAVALAARRPKPNSNPHRAMLAAGRGARHVGTVPREATVAQAATNISPGAEGAAPPSLDELRAESARLEALAAFARDDRMANGSALVLSAEAEDRVRLIDAALSQPELGAAQRIDLWTRRVEALRQLAGLETTNRWLASNGESLQGAIALVD